VVPSQITSDLSALRLSPCERHQRPMAENTVNHCTFLHLDLVDLHMLTKLAIVSRSIKTYSMTVDDFFHLSSVSDEL